MKREQRVRVGGRGLESSKWENDDWGCACKMDKHSLNTSSFQFHHIRMREQNEDGGPHAASTLETFATSKAIPMGRRLKMSWRGSDYPYARRRARMKRDERKRCRNNGNVPHDTIVPFIQPGFSTTNSIDDNLEKT